MVISLKNRNFLKLLDYTPAEIQHLIDLAIELKAAKKAGCEKQTLIGKNIALIFEKTSIGSARSQQEIPQEHPRLFCLL